MACFGRGRGAASLLSQVSLHNKDLTFPIYHVCNLVFHCRQQTTCLGTLDTTLDNSRPWESRPVEAPLPLVHSVSVKWGGWRGGGQAGPEDPPEEFQHPSSWDDGHLLCRAVRFAATSLALLQAILLSTVGCISLRVLLFVFFFKLWSLNPRISMNDY